MFSTISDIYNQPHSNAAGTNTFKVKYYDRNLANDNYIDMSINNMNYLPNYQYMSDPKKDKQILSNMREATDTYNHIQKNKETDRDVTMVQTSKQGLPTYCGSGTCGRNSSYPLGAGTMSTPDNPATNYIEPHPSSVEKFITLEKRTGILNLESPQVFGSPMWFTIHNAAIHYPVGNPSPETKLRMKNFFLSLPVLIPCLTCREHCTAYIESHKSKLDDVTSGRDKLFAFTVDFHNVVNSRLGKPEMSLNTAKAMYSGQVAITVPRIA